MIDNSGTNQLVYIKAHAQTDEGLPTKGMWACIESLRRYLAEPDKEADDDDLEEEGDLEEDDDDDTEETPDKEEAWRQAFFSQTPIG